MNDYGPMEAHEWRRFFKTPTMLNPLCPNVPDPDLMFLDEILAVLSTHETENADSRLMSPRHLRAWLGIALTRVTDLEKKEDAPPVSPLPEPLTLP